MVVVIDLFTIIYNYLVKINTSLLFDSHMVTSISDAWAPLTDPSSGGGGGGEQHAPPPPPPLPAHPPPPPRLVAPPPPPPPLPQSTRASDDHEDDADRDHDHHNHHYYRRDVAFVDPRSHVTSLRTAASTTPVTPPSLSDLALLIVDQTQAIYGLTLGMGVLSVVLVVLVFQCLAKLTLATEALVAFRLSR